MKKTKQYLLTLIILFLISIIGANYSFATSDTENSETLLLNENINYSQAYLDWLELPAEERGSVMPAMYDVKYQSAQEELKSYVSNGLILNQMNMIFETAKETIPSSYSLANDINVTIKDQGYTNECWAYSFTSVLETTISLLSGVTSTEYSPSHIDYSSTVYFSDQTITNNYDRSVGVGGNFDIALSYATRGTGPAEEGIMDNVSYLSSSGKEQNITYSSLPAVSPDVMVKDAVYFTSIYKTYKSNGNITYSDGTNALSSEDVTSIRNKIKTHIMTYGAVASYMDGNFTSASWNKNESSAYSTNESPSHAITIVGWDDNYSKSNFATVPSQDGAWVVLNSYGTGSTHDLYSSSYDGYIYISYDDATIELQCRGITDIENKDYDYIYQYDDLGMTGTVNVQSGFITKSSFTKQSSQTEYLKELGLYAAEDCYIDAKIIIGNTPTTLKSNYLLHAGYNTIELDKKTITDDYSILITYKSLDGNSNLDVPVEYYYELESSQKGIAIGYLPDISGKTYYSLDESSWGTDLKMDFCIKAFTSKSSSSEISPTSVSLNATSIEIEEGETYELTATVLPTNATDKTLTWTSSDPTVATVDGNGVVAGLKEGTATITVTTSNGKTTTCTVTVTANDVTPESITLSTSSLTLVEGTSHTLTATVSPEGANQYVSWQVADTSIATVDSNGKVTGVTVGTTTITATSTSESSVSASGEITVIEKSIESITLKTTPTKTKYTVGESLDLSGGVIVVTYDNGSSEEISLPDDDVSFSGYNSTKTGTQTITLSYEGYTTSFNITVSDSSSSDDDTSADDDLTFTEDEDKTAYEEDEEEEVKESPEKEETVDTGDDILKKVITLIISISIFEITTIKLKKNKK